MDSEFPLRSTSVGVEPTPDDLAVRGVRNPVVSYPCGSVALGSGWRSGYARWTDAECVGDPGECRNHAGCRNALDTAPREHVVAGCDIEHAVAISGRSRAAGAV